MFWLYGPLIIVLNHCDYNIDQDNRDYDFCQNRAALITIIECTYILWQHEWERYW